MLPFIFYLLSFTWGLPITAAGAVTALFMRLMGAKRSRVGNCVCYEYGRGWGGFSLGVFIFTQEGADKNLKWHEHGHGLQNCVFGPFMIFLVSLPSAVRYRYRRLKKDKSRLKPYESIWFESQATRMGQRQRFYLSFRKR